MRKKTQFTELASKVILNGNAEILVSHMNGLEEKIERRRDQLSNTKDQRFEFFNELEVVMWETELKLLQGRLKVVRND
tara:strand:+ start:645 stop:878 length:234 start_codon:yes stop_codon:yes gene_type:complete